MVREDGGCCAIETERGPDLSAPEQKKLQTQDEPRSFLMIFELQNATGICP